MNKIISNSAAVPFAFTKQ